MTEPTDVMRLRDDQRVTSMAYALTLPVYDDGTIIPIRKINEALFNHLQQLTDAVERNQASLQALHDRFDTLERGLKARGSL